MPALAYRFGGLNPVLAFWSCYVLTRPLGASFADWLGVPLSLGGLDRGRGTVAIIFTIPIVILVGYLTVSRVDLPADQRALDGAGALATGPLS